MDRVGELFKLYDLRAAVAPGSQAYLDLQKRLRSGLLSMACKRERELADPQLPAPAREVLLSMKRNWKGLPEFIRHRDVPPDNSRGGRFARPVAVSRKNFYGSGSQWSADLAATMFTLLRTVKLWGINPRTWLGAYLQVCAAAGNRAPADLRPFLPWTMDARQLTRMRALPEPLKLPALADTS